VIALELPCALQLEEAAVLLLLSDYFQTPSVTSKVEAWMCSSLRFISTQPGLEALGCTAFELATHYRLVQVPTALQVHTGDGSLRQLGWAH